MGLILGKESSPGGGNGNTLQYSCLKNSMDRGAWQSTVYGVAELVMTEHTGTPITDSIPLLQVLLLHQHNGNANFTSMMLVKHRLPDVTYLALCLGCDCPCCCFVSKKFLTLCKPLDYSPPDSSVHGIFQARILQWAAISFSRGSSQPKDQTCVSCTGRQTLYL